jgi:hypothetical protein
MASVRRAAASEHAASKWAREVPEEEQPAVGADESNRMELDEDAGVRTEAEGVPATRFRGALLVLLDDDAGSVDAGRLAKQARGKLAASAAAAQEALERGGAGVIVMRAPAEAPAEAAKQLLALADTIYLKIETKNERSVCETSAFEAFFVRHGAHRVVVADKAARKTEPGAAALLAITNRHLDIISVQ